MGFILIGRGRSEGDIRLLSPMAFDERQAALDELARMSATADFAHRDAEVYVVDLASAVPVLLVTSPAEAPEADVPVPAPAPEPDVADQSTEPVVEPDASAEDETSEADETAGVWEAPAVDDVEESADLADALKRAAGAMESSGISAPESVGPAPAGWPWEASAVNSTESDEAAADGAEAEIQPDIGTGSEEQTELEIAAESETEADAETFVFSALEDPAVDTEGGLLAAPEDAEDVEARRPVILGSYADEEAPPSPPVAEFSEPPAAEIPTEGVAADMVPTPVETAEGVDVEEAPGETEPSESHDGGIGGILADLETIEEPASEAASAVPSAFVTSASEGERDVTADLTCDDCVYVTTCPNKEGLEPSSCGNFQWKSV